VLDSYGGRLAWWLPGADGLAKQAKKQTSKASLPPSAGLEQAFAAAIRAVQSLPASDEAWAHLEELAERVERAGDAAAAYREALAQPLDRDLRKRLGQRALRFHEAWFGDDPEVIHALLLPFVDGLAENEWAFERLTRVLTLAERWDPLLDTYDRALARSQDGAQRQKLLDEAAHVAKDFAGQPERAIGYLEQLHLLEPGNTQHAGALERLLERCERIADLIALWRRQLEVVHGEPARALRLRIAVTCLDRLRDPAAAVAELRTLLDELPGHTGACEQLERVLALSAAPGPIRLQAFALLRSNYDAARRPEQVVLAIDRAIELSDDVQRRDLHREAAQRLAILDRDRESMAHYAALLL
jgi:tetratricopeptide (TPR) repeat protein